MLLYIGQVHVITVGQHTVFQQNVSLQSRKVGGCRGAMQIVQTTGALLYETSQIVVVVDVVVIVVVVAILVMHMMMIKLMHVACVVMIVMLLVE